MADTTDFAKLVPGFEFLQGLVKNAGAALPNIGQWVAPTLNPQELDKRIEELRTVQFWLEQNARMLGATIQALEVQRMTLSTLQTMNVQMDDLRESLKIHVPDAVKAPAATAATAPASSARKGSPKSLPRTDSTAAGVVDPMQWWSALTKQFTQLATTAMKETASVAAAKNPMGALVKQSVEAAGQGLRSTLAAPGKAAGKVAPTSGRAPQRKKRPHRQA